MLKTIPLLFVLCTLNGCFLAPFIDSYHQMGLNEGDRQALFPKHVKKFNDAIFWGRTEEALQYVMDDKKAEVGAQIYEHTEDERLVETKVKMLAFSEEAYKANVDVDVKYYRVPFYIVQTRREKQAWVFTVSDGWRLASRQVL